MPMIREGKKAVTGMPKLAKTILPQKAQTMGTVQAHTESVHSAVVSDIACCVAKKQEAHRIKVRELSAGQAVTFPAVPCRIVNLQMQSVNCIEGSKEWNLETLFQQNRKMS